MNKTYYVGSGAVITGDVELADSVSVWHNAVLRGDSGKITVGEGSNIQDGCTSRPPWVLTALWVTAPFSTAVPSVTAA